MTTRTQDQEEADFYEAHALLTSLSKEQLVALAIVKWGEKHGPEGTAPRDHADKINRQLARECSKNELILELSAYLAHGELIK